MSTLAPGRYPDRGLPCARGGGGEKKPFDVERIVLLDGCAGRLASDPAVGGRPEAGDEFPIWVRRSSASRLAVPTRLPLVTSRILRS